jgi:iron complex outermembrane receptor protein
MKAAVRSLVLLLVGTALLLALGRSVNAEVTDDAAVQKPAGLDEIVVTARKRAERVQDIPVAVQALSAQELQRQELNSLESVAAYTPQLTVGRVATGSGATLTLRGIGSNPSSIGIEQSVAVIIDDVYYGDGNIIQHGLLDLSHLEILKGPQALFYGKNATAGAISVTTAEPTSTPEFHIKSGYEFAGEELYEEAVGSLPLSDTLGVRVAIRNSNRFGGLFQNTAPARSVPYYDVATGTVTNLTTGPGSDAPGGQDVVARVTLKWKPTTDLTGTLRFTTDASSTNDPMGNDVAFACRRGTEYLDPGYPCQRRFVIRDNAMPTQLGASIPFARSDGALYDDYRSWSTTAALNYQISHLSITSVSNYNFDRSWWAGSVQGESSPISYTGGTQNTTFHSVSSELRALTSFDEPVNLMTGVYYQQTRRFFQQFATADSLWNSAAPTEYRYVIFYKLSTTEGKTTSPFVQLTWKALPDLEIAGGARYTHETKNSYFVQPYVSPAVLAFFYQGVPYTADQTFVNWSPEGTVTWKPSEAVTLYGSYRTGYKSGGFSNSGSYGPVARLVFEPERARGFEGGVKTTLFNNQLRLNVGAFRYNYTNLQVDFFDSVRFANVTSNAGAARTQGIETDWEFAPRDVAGLSFRGSLNFARAQYLNFVAPCYTGERPAAGCTTLAFGAPGQNLAGAPTAMAPRWTASQSAEYDADLGKRLKGAMSINAKYSAHYVSSTINEPLAQQPAYVTIDAAARVMTSDDQWELAVIGKNLTNRFILEGSADETGTGSGTGTRQGYLADQRGYVAYPRTIALEVTWRH